MKTGLLKVALSLAVLFGVSTTAVKAQDFSDPKFEKWGVKVEDRAKNIEMFNFMSDAFKLKQYDEASKYLHNLLQGAPKGTQNLYIMGAAIYKNKIAAAKTPEAQKVAIDSLMIIHDLRLANFSSDPKKGKAYILSEKAKDIITYMGDSKESRKLVKLAIDESGADVESALVQAYFNTLVADYMEDAIETSALLNEYDYLSGVTAKLPEGVEKTETQNVLDQLFLQSGAANCENLEKLFAPQVQASPDDVDLLKKVVRYLSTNGCTGPFQVKVAESFYAKEPSKDAAVALARSFESQNDMERAIKYYDEAAKLETDNTSKSAIYTSAAGSALKAGNPRAAADFARKATAVDSSNGIAYFFLAQAYGQGLNCSGFEKQAACWLIVDVLSKARANTTDPTTLDAISKSIGSYAAAFPRTEDVFLRALDPGQSYTVNCGWVSGVTTVRDR